MLHMYLALRCFGIGQEKGMFGCIYQVGWELQPLALQRSTKLE